MGKGSSEKGKTLQILISQPQPKDEKSPYFLLEKKHNVALTFHPLIKIEGLEGKQFKEQKTDITAFDSIIFTSRHAIDHFFRICGELKISISPEMRYFCVSQAVALYLQNFILYRKRKIFFGANGNNQSLFDVIGKHKENSHFLYVCSENQQDKEIEKYLKDHECQYKLAFMYKTVGNNIEDLFKTTPFDVICFFTPSGINAVHNAGLLKKIKNITIGTFGASTQKQLEAYKLTASIFSPTATSPNMAVAIDNYLSQLTTTPALAVKKAPKAKKETTAIKKVATTTSTKKAITSKSKAEKARK